MTFPCEVIFILFPILILRSAFTRFVLSSLNAMLSIYTNLSKTKVQKYSEFIVKILEIFTSNQYFCRTDC